MYAVIVARESLRSYHEVADVEKLKVSLNRYGKADVIGSWSNGRSLMVQALTWNTMESRNESPPEKCKDTGRVIASWVRLDNRHELCAQLGLCNETDITDPQIILEAHRMWRADCADRLEGDFSFVIYDPEHNETFCARDSLGVKPFTYYLNRDVFIASTSIPVLHELLSSRLTESSSWIARYLALAEADPIETPYEELKHLPRAHSLIVRNATANLTQYFSFDSVESDAGRKPDLKWVHAYEEAFDLAVKRRLRSAYPLGAEISGGLDSGGILAFAAPHLRDRLEQFHTYGFAYHEIDAQVLHQTAMHLGLLQVHTQTSPIVRVNLESRSSDAAAILGVPPRPDSHGHFEYVYKHAEFEGVRTVLSGYGGDEVTTALGGRSAIVEALWERDLVRVYRSLSGGPAARTLTGAKHWFHHKVKYSVGVDLKRSKLKRFGGFTGSLLSDSASAKFGVAAMFDAERERLEAARTFNNRLLATLRFRVFLSGRLEQVALHANRAGIEYRYPMLDRQLMVQVLSTPVIDRYADGKQRYLHRRAVEPLLPDIVRGIQKNQMGRRVAKWPWEIWHAMTPPKVDIDKSIAEFLDAKRLRDHHDFMGLDKKAFDALSYECKAFLFVNDQLLNNINYWCSK